MEKIQRLEKYETEEIQRLETGYYRNNINYDEFVNNLELEKEMKRLQKGKETEIPPKDTWDALGQYLKEEKELNEEYKKLKAGEKIPTFDIPTSSTTFVSPPPTITEPIGAPEYDEIIQYSGPRVYTDAPTYKTAPIQYIHPPQQYRLNTATSSITQITPQPISEIRHIINKVAAGTQAQPLGIANMEEINTLIKKYPDMKDIIDNPLLSELVKNKNVKREDIENIKYLSSTFNQPFTARSYNYAQNPNAIQKMAIFKKPQNLQDYENIVPPYTVRRDF